MLKPFFSATNRMPLAISGTLLLGCLLLGAVLYSQLTAMALANQTMVGNSLAYQLAYSVKTPLLHQDPLSLQVAVVEISRQPGVARVAIVRESDRPLAEKIVLSEKDHRTSQYRRPIVIENATAGYAVVELSDRYYRAQSLSLFKISLMVLLLLAAAVLSVTWNMHRQGVRRITSLLQRLPEVGSDTVQDGDELSRLEQKIRPLLTVSQPSPRPVDQEQRYSTFAGLSFRNFNALQEQLSNSHFVELMTEVDSLLAGLIKLYNGRLISFADDLLVLQFVGETADDDFPVRALYCVFALRKQFEKWRDSKGLEIDITVVIRSGELATAPCDLLTHRAIEVERRALRALAEKASIGEVLLDKATGEHPALDHIALLEPASAKLDIFRCEGLESTADTLVVRQLAIIASAGMAAQQAT